MPRITFLLCFIITCFTIQAQTMDIHERLAKLSHLSYTTQDFKERMLDGRLATVYAQLSRQQQFVSTLKGLTYESLSVEAADKNLKKLLDSIKTFYADYINQSYIGDKEAYLDPEVIVILGANRPALDQRLAHALPIIQKFPEIPVVLSGGGRTIVLEAEFMRDYLKKAGVPDSRLLMETDSVDTVGNAVFSSFVLSQTGRNKGKILIVTSNFHAPRSLFLFKSVLGESFSIAVSLAPYSGSDLSSRIASELQQEAVAEGLFYWGKIEDSNSKTKTPCDIFFQMLSYHKLYEARWDLARRYADVCQLNKP